MTLQQLRKSVWRVPLISLAACLLYTTCYVHIVLRFGVIEPGVIDDTISLLTSGFLMLATFILGWLLLLRKQTRKEIFLSATIVVVYGLLLWIVQYMTGSTTGPAAVVFMHLYKPLEWMGFFSELGLYMKKHVDFSIPLIGYLHFFVPWLFALFGRKNA